VALAQLEVIDRLEVELRPLADLAQGDVVLIRLAVRCIRIGNVREHRQQGIAALVEVRELGLQLLQLALQLGRGLPQLLELRIVGLPRPRGLLDLTGKFVLVRANRIDAGVEFAPPLVDFQDLVELLGGPAARQRRANGVRLAADLLEVERGPLSD
jgi:hypothetical protein